MKQDATGRHTREYFICNPPFPTAMSSGSWPWWDTIDLISAIKTDGTQMQQETDE